MKDRFLFILFCFFVFRLSGQDQQFTQFFASPLTLNPALTGTFDGKYRLGLIYRDQWSKITDVPYRTFGTAIDLRFPVKAGERFNADAFGAGIQFYSDKVPAFDFSTTQMQLSLAYHKSLGRQNNQFLSIGFQAAIVQKNLNYENLNFDDQFNGTTGYTDPSEEVLPGNNFSYLDYVAGINYTLAPKGKPGIFAGFAISHFNRPQISFYYDKREPIQKGNDLLHMKYTAYLSGQIPLGEWVSIHPRALAYLQGPHFTANAGTNFRFSLDNSKGMAIHLGAWARSVRDEGWRTGLESVVGILGLEFSNVLLGISYDANTNPLVFNGRQQSTLEISLAYLGNYLNEAILCPGF